MTVVSAQPIERNALGAAVGAEIRGARQRAGLGLREAARRVGIGHPFLIALERGERAPSGRTAAALARVVALDADTMAALYAVAARVDAARLTRECDRNRGPRRPRG